jgi:aspartate aminotransferase
MSDDIYEHIIYDEFNFYTPAQNNKIFDRTLTVNGVSKSYAMTGWRIGYAGGPEEIIKGMAKLQSQSTTNPSSISQAAAVEALKGDQVFIQTRKKVFKKRRDFIVEMLNKINGIECIKPQGAFYVFPSCKKLIGKKHQKLGLIKNDKDFVTKLLESYGVAVVQGSAFGLDGYFRISYAASDDELKKAIDRITKFCSEII